MNKIRTLVAHNNEEIRESIVNSIKVLDYVDIVATAKDGIDTYKKIVELKPDIVFSEYNFNDMPGLELVRKTKNELKDNFPSFNTIGLIPEDELEQVVSVTGSKLNSFICKPYGGGAKDIIQSYKEDKSK